MDVRNSKPVEQVVAAIAALDLEPIKFKLMDAEEGQGWSREYVEKMAVSYKRFLTLLVTHPETSIAPSKDIDKFWHGHILDTMKYADDCENIFGYFLHHFPYFGMRGEEDAAQLAKAGKEMSRLYEQEFGEPMSQAAAYCSAATKAAYCSATTEAAYCSAAAKPAYCSAATEAKSAYCSAAVKPAYCSAATEAKAAYCSAATKADSAAYCSAATSAKPDLQSRPTLAKAAYCSATTEAKSAYCSSGTQAAYCSASAKPAYCSATTKADSAAYCSAAISAKPDLQSRPTLAMAA